jgi:hypothetical protein
VPNRFPRIAVGLEPIRVNKTKGDRTMKKKLYKLLDFLFPMLMDFIWGTHFLLYCRKCGYAVFGGKSEQEALDYLTK